LLFIQPILPEKIILAKLFSHWLIGGLPIVLASPLLGLLMNVPADQIGYLSLSLLVGTPALSIIGGLGAALTLGLKRGSGVLSILVLPLYIPILIFASGALQGDNYWSSIFITLGLSLFMLPVNIVAIIYAVKIANQE
jgi:heme exporter protein B